MTKKEQRRIREQEWIKDVEIKGELLLLLEDNENFYKIYKYGSSKEFIKTTKEEKQNSVIHYSPEEMKWAILDLRQNGAEVVHINFNMIANY